MVIPFIDKGIPIEYELVRSICTVAEQQRKKLGVLKTDVQLVRRLLDAGADRRIAARRRAEEAVRRGGSRSVEADHRKVRRAAGGAAVVAQPEAMDNFVAAVKCGQPTAIFEDPYPGRNSYPEVVGTAQPKRPPGGMMGMFGGGGQPEPKGDISQLWKLLGVEMYGDEIVWQDFNPEPKLGDISDEWIFIDEGLASHGTPNPFDPDDPISAGMKQVLFFWSGSFRPAEGSKLDFQKLAVTGRNTGTVSHQDVDARCVAGIHGRSPRHDARAVHCRGTHHGRSDCGRRAVLDGQERRHGEAWTKRRQGDAKRPRVKTKRAMPMRRRRRRCAGRQGAGENEARRGAGGGYRLDRADHLPAARNGARPGLRDRVQVPERAFVLNILDSLAGDDRFVDLRKRTRSHRILTKVEEATEEHRKAVARRPIEVHERCAGADRSGQEEFRKKIADLEGRTDLDPRIKENARA